MPEVLLRRALHRDGIRFRLHRKLVGKCEIDIALVSDKIAVFVDGCFWHGCPTHRTITFGGPNADRWEAKIARNIERDAANTDRLIENGWRVVRIWECEVSKDINRCVSRIVSLRSVDSDLARKAGKL